MKKAALILMILTIFSKVFGFAREIVLAYFYGASNISDAYLISMTVPSVIFSFIGTGIATGYIPMYSNIEKSSGIDEGNNYTNNLINLLLIICGALIIFGLFFTEPIVKIFASGFQGDTLDLAIKFTRVSMFGIFFTALISVYGGFLQLKGNYYIPALVGVPLNFFIISSIFLSKNTNTMVLIIGTLIATASQLLLIIPFLKKKGYKYKLIINIKDEYIVAMAKIAWPVIIGVSVNQINVLVDRTMASRIAVGGISALNYANRLNNFVQALFVVSIVTVLYPMISKMAAEKNMNGLKKSLLESIGVIDLFIIPVTVGAMMFSRPIVALLFGRGAFDGSAIEMTANGLLYYSIGMIGFGLREVLSRAFYSLQDTKTPMINAAIAMTLNIILNIVLSHFMGIGGLALATSISAIFATLLLFMNLRKKIGAFGLKNISISFFKILISSLIMGFVAKFTHNLLTNYISENVSLMTSIALGGTIYLIIIYFMKIDDVDVIVNALKKKIGKEAA